MKVAFCYSGMFRNFHSKIDNHLQKLASKYDSDFYLSFWNMNGIGNFRRKIISSNTDIIDSDIKHIVEKKLKPIFIEYEDFNYMESLFNNVIEKEKFQTIQAPFPLNIMSMYYKIHKCMEKVLASHKTYDLIVRIRPDLEFNSNVDLDRVPTNHLAYNELNSWNGSYNDQIFYGDTSTMTVVCNLYHDLPKLWNKLGINAAPEALLFDYLNNYNIKGIAKKIYTSFDVNKYD